MGFSCGMCGNINKYKSQKHKHCSKTLIKKQRDKLWEILLFSDKKAYVLVRFLSTLQNRESAEKREPQLKQCPHTIGLQASLWIIFLIDNRCGRD